MSEKEFNEIFSRNLKYYMEREDLSQAELARKLHVGATSVYNWVNGIKTPRMDKVDAMCELFGCKRSDLISERPKTKEGYYFNEETAAAAQKIFENPGLRLLFDAECDMSPEQISAVYNIISAFKEGRANTDDTGD